MGGPSAQVVVTLVVCPVQNAQAVVEVRAVCYILTGYASGQSTSGIQTVNRVEPHVSGEPLCGSCVLCHRDHREDVATRLRAAQKAERPSAWATTKTTCNAIGRRLGEKYRQKSMFDVGARNECAGW